MPVTLGTASYAGFNDYENHFDGDVRVGNYTSIGRYVTFLSGPGSTHYSKVNHKYVTNYGFVGGCLGPIDIGSDVWIGTRAIILGGVTIGHGAIVGAGTIVTKDVPPFGVMVGSPPRVVSYRFDEETIRKLLAIAWWDWDHRVVESIKHKFHNVDEFVHEYYDSKASNTDLTSLGSAPLPKDFIAAPMSRPKAACLPFL